jgi:hypothetical protein
LDALCSFDWIFRGSIAFIRRRVLVAHVEHRGLRFGGSAEFIELVLAPRLRFVLFSLASALGLISLSLLPCLFFLPFCERGSASWHIQPPLN